MPPIRQQLDEAFLAQLLQQQKGDDISDTLNTNIDSASLSLVLKRLDSTSHAFQQELIQQVHTHFDEFATSYNTSQKLHNDILQLVKEASSTQDKVAHIQTTVTDTIDAYQDALTASQTNKKKMDLLDKLQHMLQIIELVHQELKETSYVEAVQHALELERILTTWKDQQEVTSVLDMMKERIGHLKQSLIQQLEEEVHTSMQYNMGSMRILTRAFSEKHVFECLDQLGLLAETMMGVQRQIFKHILNPYFDTLHNQLQVDHVTVDHLGSGGVLQVIPITRNEVEEEMERLNPVHMMKQMDTILSFFYKYMFDNKRGNINLLFGNLLLHELMNKMITKGISPSIPSSKESLDQFNTITKHVSTFEGQIATYGFIPSSDTETALGHYVQQIDKHYAKYRRNKILQQGRKVMTRRLYDAEMIEVIETDGHKYNYQITQTPQILAVLISDTISEAIDLLTSHPISASTLVEGIQDLLDMYRAMMPSFHRPQYLSSPAKSMVFRNDCLWLSHQLTTSIQSEVKSEEQQFSPQLSSVLQESASRLIELGKAWHELTMMHRVQMIQHVLDSLEGFSGMTSGDSSRFQHDCELAISQVIQLIQSFASDVRSVVDETVFLDMMGRLVENCLERLITDIEELVDIGAEESHVIALTLNSFAQLAVPSDTAAFGENASDAFVSELVPSWQKLWLLKDILEMNMKEIMQAYRKGDLHMFEKSELVGLLCALFADTELRELNIQEIKFGEKDNGKFVIDDNVRFSRQQDAELEDSATPVSRQVHYQQEPIKTSTASVTTTMAQPTTASALEYTLDEDMLEQEGTGWGDEDDDDLFATTSAKDAATMVTPLQTTSHGDNPISRLPNSMRSSKEFLEPTMDIDFDAGESSGWGDADQDIFMEGDDVSDQQQAEEQQKQEISSSHLTGTPPPTTTIQNDKTHGNALTNVTLEESKAVAEKEDEPYPGNNINKLNTTTSGLNPSNYQILNAGAANSSTPVITNITQPSSSNLSLDLSAIDHEIDQELEEQEEGEGWGWDDDDEDLFKDQDELR